MHGYFMDIRLYHKAKSIADPFAYEQYRKNKIKEKIEAARANRVQIKVSLFYRITLVYPAATHLLRDDFKSQPPVDRQFHPPVSIVLN